MVSLLLVFFPFVFFFFLNLSDLLQKHQTLGLDGEVVIDDREESVGFKLKDAQLIGYPWIVVVGKCVLLSFVTSSSSSLALPNFPLFFKNFIYDHLNERSFLGTEKAEFYIRGVEGMKLLGQDELIEAMQRDQ